MISTYRLPTGDPTAHHLILNLLQQLTGNTLTPDGQDGDATIQLHRDQLSTILQQFRQQQEAIQHLLDSANSSSSSTFTTPSHTIQQLNPSLNTTTTLNMKTSSVNPFNLYMTAVLTN